MYYASRDKATYVRDTFNSIANSYDLMNGIMSLGLDKRWRRQTVRHVEAGPGMHILDACCGTGRLSRELNKAVGAAGHITGVDFSVNMLEVAKKNVGMAKYPGGLNFQQGDVMALPFQDNTFDGVTIGWGLRNLSNWNKGIRELSRVVKPGGLVVSIDMGKPTVPVFKSLYWFMFEKAIPALGKLYARNRQAYKYLHDSSVAFPAQHELKKMFMEAGLVEAGYCDLFGGAVAIVYGRKPR